MTGLRRQLVLVAAGALLLRLFLLYLRGDYIVFDEGYYLLLSRSLRAGDGFALNGLKHVALSPLQPLLVAGLSFLGIPDLWASRLLAALCGALLVIPVALLARRWYGDRGGLIAALVTAVFPSLLTFLPFFPGRGWNLYFGSEPLFLLLGTSAVAAAVHAFESGRLRYWLVSGVLADLSYLTRLEGAVLGTSLGVALVAAFLLKRRPGLVRALLVYASSVLITVPYLLYLHGALGRWAVSGRVQAAVSGAVVAPVATSVPESDGSSAVNDFVWGGNVERLWRTLYALDGSATQMSSQYWGVPRQPVQPALSMGTSIFRPPQPAPTASKPATFLRAVAIVVHPLAWVLAAFGVIVARRRRDALVWLAPMLVTAIVPALLAYAEPRALLMFVPAVCVLSAGCSAAAERFLASDGRTAWLARVYLPTLLLGLLLPTVVAAAGSWTQQAPLQRIATARRLVGEYLAARLPDSARVVSWHPAVAIFARRDWRVLPYAPLGDIVTYARAQGAETVVFSRFDPSPINNPPRAFTALLVDSASSGTGAVRLDPVETLPFLFVGRLAPAPVP